MPPEKILEIPVIGYRDFVRRDPESQAYVFFSFSRPKRLLSPFDLDIIINFDLLKFN